MNDILKLSAFDLNKLILNKEITVTEVVHKQIEKIRINEFNSYIRINEEEALIRAKEVEGLIDMGLLKDSPLAGVPVSIKDNICMEGITTTCASKMLSNFVPSYDATVIKKLNEAGAIIIGKTNMDEMAMGGSTTTSFFGYTKNPCNKEYIPGGSSGGSGASVAGHEAFISLGTDTGGSIRQPASYCGVVGLKPTYGRVSRHGLVAYASSLDQIGPMARNVRDAGLMLEVISGKDPLDPVMDGVKGFTCKDSLIKDLSGVKIGVPREYMGADLEDEVRKSIRRAIDILRSNGAIIEECSLSTFEYTVPTYFAISCAEASSNLGRYDGLRYGICLDEYKDKYHHVDDFYKAVRSMNFGMVVRKRILLGAYILKESNGEEIYRQALKVRGLIKEEFNQIFEKYDLILGPTTPSLVPSFKEELLGDSTLSLSTKFTAQVNLAGLPAISLPCGLDHRGLPIGLQLIGKPFGENEIIRAAFSYESERDYD